MTAVSSKTFVGQDIIHVAVWKKNDKHMIYNIAYINKKNKYTYVKRFAATSLILNKVYIYFIRIRTIINVSKSYVGIIYS